MARPTPYALPDDLAFAQAAAGGEGEVFKRGGGAEAPAPSH